MNETWQKDVNNSNDSSRNNKNIMFHIRSSRLSIILLDNNLVDKGLAVWEFNDIFSIGLNTEKSRAE